MKSKNAISIIIADDHPLILKGLFEELTAAGYNVLDTATQGMEALEMVLTHNPNVALLDIDMPMLTGFDVIKTAKGKGTKTKFIVLSFHKESEYVAQAKALQIQGYLLKEDSFSEIEKCIQSVLDGKTYFSPSFDSFSLQNASEELRKLQLLTPSEATILKLIAKQVTTAEIAQMLSVSGRTIEKHRSNIIAKLSLDNTPNSLISWALANKNVIAQL
jgi:DNA-binding NarL/FixJ family response regulator